jgi:prepilin-type N-terminal cleavage/methylation domain-containing protein
MKLSFKNKKNKGFTLIELLVTITMFVILTGVVLVNSNKFDNSILLHNFAYDVALTIKQAQSYGVNVRENSSGSFNSAYGVYFDRTISSTNFILFNDVDGNNIYPGTDFSTCPTVSECVQRYSMTKGTSIQSMCAGKDASSCSSASKLSILFIRPNLNANIYYSIDNNPVSTVKQPYAQIVLAAGNSTSTVVVTSIGQIYVKN